MRKLVIVLACLAPIASQAQQPVPLTPDAAAAQAVRRHPRLSATLHEVEAARAGVRSAAALANPHLVFLPAITPGGSDEELLLQQPLEINGTRAARKGLAQAGLREAEADALFELRALVLETKLACIGLARARQQESVAREALKTAEEIHSLTQRQVEVGVRPGIDQTQTEIEVGRARQDMTLAAGAAAGATARLKELLGETPPSVALGAPGPTPADLKPLIAQALGARSEVAREAALRDRYRQEGRLARAEGRPDLTPQFRATSVTRGVHETGIGIGITLPLFDYGSRRNRIRQAESAAKAQDARVEATRLRVAREVEEALAHLAAADEVARRYDTGLLQQSERLLEGSRKAFQSGLTTVVQMIEAQRTYRAVRAELAAALAERAAAAAELEWAIAAVPAHLLEGARP